jgi:predicted phage terminase large subunit-like protein
LYESADGKFPPFEYVIASVDSAFTAKEQNDPTGFTAWGVFFDGGKTLSINGQLVNTNGHRRIMLIKAWRKHLPFSGPRIERGEREPWPAYKRRTQDSWGLLEWLYDSISNHAFPPSHPRHWTCHKLLIEAKASGISAAQELRNRFRFAESAIQLVQPKGDKLARALAVQPMFSQFGIFAPNRDWAEMVITEMSTFPQGKRDDLTDSTTQALKFLRDVGLGETDREVEEDKRRAVQHRPRMRSLYPC